MAAQHAEVAQPQPGRLAHYQCGGRGGGLEADREEHDLARRLAHGERERVGGGIHHAHVGTARLR
ncbi:MAG: hypothetical protein JNK52_05870, partial [Zoogloeaceae bacterium]|nr:hypothetical protein [Zoogloeaceae bacterium]